MMIFTMTLAVGVLLLLSLFALAIFTDNRMGATRIRHAIQTWLPPALSGRQLEDWAAATAEIATLTKLSECGTTNTGVDLAKEIDEGVDYANRHGAEHPIHDPGAGCPAQSNAVIAVTPPEVLRIAEQLRNEKRAFEVDGIRQRALENLRKVADKDRCGYACTDTCCPLYGENGCAVYCARPIRCRGLEQEAHESGQEARPTGELANPVAVGAQHGISIGLKSAGLDGGVYELNSALVAALDHPDAGERWVSGQEIFEHCKEYV